MRKTLIILSHPDFKTSIGNKIISTVLAEEENISVRHLDELYPDFKIDIKAEQAALLEADTIIFQYPLFWYNVPALLKQWIDEVFQYGFAFGGDSYQLAGKNVIVSFTMGSPKKDYPTEIIKKITFPFQGLAKYCRMNYVDEVVSGEINNYSEGAEEKAKKIANEHAQQLLTLLNK